MRRRTLELHFALAQPGFAVSVARIDREACLEGGFGGLVLLEGKQALPLSERGDLTCGVQFQGARGISNSLNVLAELGVGAGPIAKVFGNVAVCSDRRLSTLSTRTEHVDVPRLSQHKVKQ